MNRISLDEYGPIPHPYGFVRNPSMIPFSLSSVDLQDTIGFRDGLLDAGTASPAAEDAPALTEPQMDALRSGALTYLESAEGEALLQAMRSDLSLLARYAREHCRPDAASRLAALPQRLDADYVAPFWWDVLVEGRQHLRALAQAITNDLVPTERRCIALENLADGIGKTCGTRLSEELRVALTPLRGYGGGLRTEYARVFEQSRDALIVRECRQFNGESPDVHGVARVRKALRRPPLQLGLTLRHQFSSRSLRLAESPDVARCREAIERELTPAHLARLLAEECLGIVHAAFLDRIRGPVDLANDTRQLAILNEEVAKASLRFGSLNVTSFMELDDDALPRLIDDAGLIAIDIRRHAASQKLVGPAEVRPLLTVGNGPSRVVWRVVDEALDELLLGDAGVEEHQPATSRRLCDMLETWQACPDPRPPLPWLPEPLRQRFLVDLLPRLSAGLIDSLPASWFLDTATAQRAGIGPGPLSIKDWLESVDPATLDAEAAAAIWRYLRLHPDTGQATRGLFFLRPELAVPLCAGVASTVAALSRMGAAQQAREASVLMEGLEPALRMLSQDEFRALLRHDGPLHAWAWAGFKQPELLSPLLSALERLHHSGTMRDDHWVDLFNVGDPDLRSDLPMLLRAQGEVDAGGLPVFADWLESVAPRVLGDAALRALTFPTLPDSQAATWMRRQVPAYARASFERYLQTLERGIVSGRVDISDVMRTLTVRNVGDTPGIAYLSSRNGIGLVKIVIEWATRQVLAGRMPQACLERLIMVCDTDLPRQQSPAVHDGDLGLAQAVAALSDAARRQSPSIGEMARPRIGAAEAASVAAP
ncbi:hypothetical protein [Mitsuaria sp. 7]|uniref:hypothetical protein n=1 Tax=Mitsuaria sp. 7 TaxID=1658665 RepID=UPI0012FC0178|nr:hypothetical protein [Mitsuaria sp. 7]